MKFDNMPDNMKSTEVFFRLERCANIFSRLSSIIPKQLLAVVQSIHGELCESLVLVSKAGNEPMPKKLEYLTLAERKLFYLYNRIQYLVEARSISIGQANEFTAELKEAYTQTRKWLNATRRDKYYVRYVDDMYLIDESKEKLIETRKNVESMLMKQGMRLNAKKSIIQRSDYGISFLGVVVKPHYAILGKQRINRIYKCSHEFSDPYKAYESSATRKGMFERYKGYRIAKRWYMSFPEELKKYIYMDNRCNFVWLGEKPQRNRLLISLEEEDMKYKIVFSNGTAKIVDHPNFIKMNPRYPSFVCCGRDDAECVMLQDGEESVCYNIAVKRYPEYDVVDVRAV